MVAQPRECGVGSAPHRRIETALCNEAGRVPDSRLHTGRLFAEAPRRVHGEDLYPTTAELERLERDRQQREDLVQEIPAPAIEKFRAQMHAGNS